MIMDLKNKLKGLPPVYYINLDNRTDRREYMESQFDYWGIVDYHRVSASKYLASKFDEWKYLISNEKGYELNPMYNANFITHLEMIKNWLETTNDEYMIMMEDDYDLSLIEYWNFDWDYLMNHIPFDWDCIQLGFVLIDICGLIGYQIGVVDASIDSFRKQFVFEIVAPLNLNHI